MKKSLTTFFLFLIIVTSPTFAQNGMNLNNLPPFEASNYFQPMATYLGTYFNSGTYYTADVPETFGFKFSIIGMWSIVPDNQKTFTPDPRLEGINDVPPTATIFGNHSSYFLGDKGFFVYPTGFSLNAIPLGIYQFSGSLFNTELMIRFFPNTKFDKAEVGVFGFGLKHDISSHIPLFPVDLAVQVLYNHLNVEYIGENVDEYGKVNSNNYAINVHASKTFMDMFIVYSGLQFETSTTDLGYYFDDPNNYYPEWGNMRQSIKINGENHLRYTLGGAVKLSVFVINADLNIAAFNTFTLGLSLDF